MKLYMVKLNDRVTISKLRYSISKYLGTIRADMDDEEKQNKNRINDPEVYEEIYKISIELSENYQLIIVDNTPPNDYAEYSKYTFLKGSAPVPQSFNVVKWETGIRFIKISCTCKRKSTTK